MIIKIFKNMPTAFKAPRLSLYIIRFIQLLTHMSSKDGRLITR